MQEATGCMHACPRNIRKQLSLSILGTTLYAGVYDFHLETFCCIVRLTTISEMKVFLISRSSHAFNTVTGSFNYKSMYV